jgi:hypothetical protein
MSRSLGEPRQPTRPASDTARDVWVDLLAEIIVAAVQQEERDAGSSQVPAP